MSSVKKVLAVAVICLFSIVLLVSFLALSDPDDWKLSQQDLLNQSPQPDLIVTISEDYLNSIVQSELKKREKEGVKNVTLFLNEDAPVEVAVVLQLSLGFATLEPKIRVKANLSAENNLLKVTPESLGIGQLNLPRSTWIGPLNSAMDAVEDAANQAAQEVLQKGFKITGVYTGDRYITLTISAPPPDELSRMLIPPGPSVL
ncbi:MAG: hypothetical protein QUS09_09510 [Methanotrichaceae archaeon]|nr:hypothetical protein [Methanotrichaceae archaeon]